MIQRLYRWIFKRCMDCGIKLTSAYSRRGEVCKQCVDDFNGLTIDELMGEK